MNEANELGKHCFLLIHNVPNERTKRQQLQQQLERQFGAAKALGISSVIRLRIVVNNFFSTRVPPYNIIMLKLAKFVEKSFFNTIFALLLFSLVWLPSKKGPVVWHVTMGPLIIIYTLLPYYSPFSSFVYLHGMSLYLFWLN